MKIICPKCGKVIDVPGLGRRRLQVSVRNILDCVKATNTALAASQRAGVSKSYLFAVLKRQNLKLADVRHGVVPKH